MMHHHRKQSQAVEDGVLSSVSGGTRAQRKSTNVTLSADLVAEAKTLGVNVSQAAEVGLAAAVAHQRAQHWLAENGEALASSNAFVEERGLPLARYRNF